MAATIPGGWSRRAGCDPVCERVPEHLEYDSQMLAENAAALHLIEFPHCGGIVAFPCGSHWHIGHRQRHIGDACKARHAEWKRGAPPDRDTLQPSP